MTAGSATYRPRNAGPARGVERRWLGRSHGAAGAGPPGTGAGIDGAETGPGRGVPLGPTQGAGGTNVALWSSSAELVQLCLFDESGAENRIALREKTHDMWHGYVPGIKPGQRYGFRVAGDPGLRHDQAKLLLD